MVILVNGSYILLQLISLYNIIISCLFRITVLEISTCRESRTNVNRIYLYRHLPKLPYLQALGERGVINTKPINMIGFKSFHMYCPKWFPKNNRTILMDSFNVSYLFLNFGYASFVPINCFASRIRHLGLQFLVTARLEATETMPLKWNLFMPSNSLFVNGIPYILIGKKKNIKIYSSSKFPDIKKDLGSRIQIDEVREGMCFEAVVFVCSLVLYTR